MDQVNDYELLAWITGRSGFAAYYCKKCEDKHMDVEIFEKLVELDAKLGITATKQLYYCIRYTSRLDIIKV